ncbi:hypothetical protein TNCV_949901 [Trichonephila clavipes]|nr:hypothetical protein TNCV_949901 [Trichonephila clavipes]
MLSTCHCSAVLPLAAACIKCMSAFSFLVKSSITTEIESANVHFRATADHWHTAFMSSTIAVIVSPVRHDGPKARMVVGGGTFSL